MSRLFHENYFYFGNLWLKLSKKENILQPMIYKDTNHDQEFSNQLGENLRRLRLKHGYTQKEIAAALDVSFQQIQKYESGQNRLPVEKLLILKQLYDISFDAFFPRAGITKDIAFDPQRLKRATQQVLTMDDSVRQKKISQILHVLLEF